MHPDQDLSRRLTATIRATTGVGDVFPAQPIVEAAAGAIAVKLALRAPDVLVDIDRDGGSMTITAGIAANDDRPAPETIREVGERLRDTIAASEPESGQPDLITVTIRVIDAETAPHPPGEHQAEPAA